MNGLPRKASDFLKRYENLTPPEKTLKEALIKEASKHEIVIDYDDIVPYGPLVRLVSPSVIKFEVLLKKKEILAGLKESLGAKAPHDIY